MVSAVLDASIFMDAFDRNYQAAKLAIMKEVKGEYSLVASNNTTEEMLFVLKQLVANTSSLDMYNVMKILVRMHRRSICIEPINTVSHCKAHEVDNRLIECAIEGNADYIVSSNRHLLDIKEEIYNSNKNLIRIVNAVQFINELENLNKKAVNE